MCFERSVLAHNLAKLIGENSCLIMKNSHAYVLVEGANNYIIFDPSNPTFAERNGQKLMMPSFLNIRKDKIDDFIYGSDTLKLRDSKILEHLFPDIKEFDIPDVVYNGLNLEKTKDNLV